MKTVIIGLAASVISVGVFAASHAEKGAMAKPAASAPMAKAMPAAAPAASSPMKKDAAAAKKTRKSASAPA